VRPCGAQASDGTATDNPVLDKGEFLVITLDFGMDNRAVFSPAESNPSLVALGVPSSGAPGIETLATTRVARLSGFGNPRNGFGVRIASAEVTVANFEARRVDLVGPNASWPHLELSVRNYSSIAAALALTASGIPNVGVRRWDPAVPCVAMSVNLGSIDDGFIGEDTLLEQQNCPSPSPSPAAPSLTPSSSSSLSPSFSQSSSSSSSPSSSPSSTPSSSPSWSRSPGSESPSPSPSPSRGPIVFTGHVDVDFPVGPGVWQATEVLCAL